MSRALLLVGHGSHLNPDSSAPVYMHAKELRTRALFDEVEAAFWKEEPNLSHALDGIASDDVTVVPIFISSGYFTKEIVPRELGLNDKLTEIGGRLIRYTEPIGAHPSLAKVIVQRAREAGAEGSEALAVLGHGTPRNPRSEQNVYDQADRVAQLGHFAEVVTVFLDQEPQLGKVFDLVKSQRIVMVPLFIADGWHVGQTIPAELEGAVKGLSSGQSRLRFGKAVGTHPSIVDVVEQLAEEAYSW